MNDMKPKTAAVVAFLFIVAIAASGVYDLQPPAPLPASAPDSLFSADRAAGYIKEIARSPHPLGSPENAAVREYLVGQLDALGLHPRLDTSVVTGAYNGIHYAARVINIVANLPGTADTKAVLLTAHYDSVPTGPGASDDASGVATVLETLRALKSSQPLKNDVIAVLTDGEEPGLMGGQALAENDSLLKRVGVALNFEARGTSGPSIMFETSPGDNAGNGNGWIVKQLAASAADPVGTSISEVAYKHLPNNTDFTWLKKKGIAGMNFAFIGNLDRYHSELDDYADINEASIQHDGSYALSLTRYFGDIRLPGPKYVNYVYFNFFWPGFVAYPSTLSSVISILAVIIFLLAAYVGIRKTVVNPVKALISVVLSIVPLAALGAGTYFLWKLLQSSYPESSHFLFGVFYNDGQYLCASILAAIALTTAFYIFLRRFFRSSEMAIGALFVWLILAVASSYYFPEGAYIFQWPLLFSSLSLLIFFLAPKSDFRSPLIMLCFLVCSIPGIYLVSSTSYLMYLTGLLPAIAAAIVVLVILGIYTLLPHVAIIASPGRWVLPIASIVLGAIVVCVALLSHRLDEHHPATDSIDYAIDVNDSSAYWLSFDDHTDAWTSQFIRDRIQDDSIPDFFPSWWEAPQVASKARAIQIAPVSLALTSDTASRGAQFLQFLLKPPQSGDPVTVIAGADTHILSSAIDGRPIPDSTPIYPVGKQERWILHCYGLPESGAELSLVIPAGEKPTLTTIGVVSGLPHNKDVPYFPRPGSLMRRPFVTTDASVVIKSYSF